MFLCIRRKCSFGQEVPSSTVARGFCEGEDADENEDDDDHGC